MQSFRRVCELCGSKKLSAQYVEEMMKEEDMSWVSEVNKSWRAYQAGASVMYGSVPRVRPVKQELRCNCVSVLGVTPAQRVIREEYRDVVLSKFGGELSVALLLALPTKFVAWENSALVGVKHTGDGLVVSDVGEKLFDVVSRMAIRGMFRAGVPKMAEADVLHGYTYLHMVFPVYRPMLAAEIGPVVSVRGFFSRVEPEWVDWDAMLSMQCVVGPDGHLTIQRVKGASAVSALAYELALGLDKLVAPLVPGTSVGVLSTCVQLLPSSSAPDGAWQVGEHMSDQVVHVNLAEGTSFLPCGKVLLAGEHCVVVFDPGVEVVLMDGTQLLSEPGGLCLFVNGTVMVELYHKLCPRLGFFSGAPTGYREFVVPVVTTTYANDTPLGAWYKRRFDVFSTEARFAVQQASMLVLYMPPSCRSKSCAAVTSDLFDGDSDGSVVSVDAYTGLQVGRVYALPTGFVVFRDVRADVVVRIGGTVVMGTGSSVACVDDAWFDVEQKVKGYGCVVAPFGTCRMKSLVVGDGYHIDGGGPSDSEGFYDETDTHVEIARHSDWLHAMQCGSGYVDDPGGRWSYLLIVVEPVTAVRRFGSRVKLEELMAAPVSLFSPAALVDTGIIYEGSAWRVVDREGATYTWVEVARAMAAWDATSLWRCGASECKCKLVHCKAGSLGQYLWEKYGGDIPAIRAADVCN